MRRRAVPGVVRSVVVGVLVGGAALTAIRGGAAQDVEQPPEPASPEPQAEPGESAADGADPTARQRAALRVAFDEARATYAAAAPRIAAAHRELEARRWDAAARQLAAVAEELRPSALLGGLRDECLYNAACAYARSGSADEAFAALREALVHGVRDAARPEGDRLVVQRGLTVAHLLVDPDLASLHALPAWEELVAPLVRGGDAPLLVRTAAAAPDGARVPGVVVLAPSGAGAADVAAELAAALDAQPAVLAIVDGPVRPRPGVRAWLLEDGDRRFGAARAGAALDALRADARVDPEQVLVAAADPAAVVCALDAALARPRDVAGLVLGPSRFDAAWHADALAALSAARAGTTPWRVVQVGTAPAATQSLRAAGADVVDGAADARAALVSWFVPR